MIAVFSVCWGMKMERERFWARSMRGRGGVATYKGKQRRMKDFISLKE
jgi:hypothetical protein